MPAATVVNGLTAAPLTPVWYSGCEQGSLAHDNFAGSGGTYSTTHYHKSINEQLGVASDAGRSLLTAGYTTRSFRQPVREFVIGAGHKNTVAGSRSCFVYCRNSASENLVRYNLVHTTFDVALLRQTTQVAISAAGVFDCLTSGEFRYSFFHAYVANSAGFMHFHDGTFDLAHRVVTFSGDTTNYATTTVDRLFIQSDVNLDWQIDDIVVYARTLFYTGFSGTAAAIGQTLTGGTSGATATVDAIETEGTTGIVYLYLQTGNFVSGETITFSAGGTATTANALPSSLYGLAQPVFIRHRAPTSDLTSPVEWTRSAGATDYAAIDDPAHTSDGVYLTATAIAQKTKHAIADAPSGLYLGAAFIAAQGGGFQDAGGIGSLRYNITDGATTETGDDLAVPGTSEGAVYGVPATCSYADGAAWDNADLDALILEIESRT